MQETNNCILPSLPTHLQTTHTQKEQHHHNGSENRERNVPNLEAHLIKNFLSKKSHSNEWNNHGLVKMVPPV